MGVLHTESWMRFARGIFQGALGDSATNPINADTEYVLRGGVYNDTIMAPLANGTGRTALSAATNPGNPFSIVQDPIIATKNRLGVCLPLPTAGAYTSTLAIERLFPVAKTHYMLGFLVRFNAGALKAGNPTTTYPRGTGFCFTIPNGPARAGNTSAYLYTASPSISTYNIFTISDIIGATSWAGANGQATSYSRGDTPPTFYINGTRDKNGSGKVLAYDTDYFIEIEVDTVAQTLKFWIDDVYVGAGTWNAAFSTLSGGFGLWAMQQNGATTDIGSAMLSDMYVIDMADGVVPNTRLGASTRVMGEAPDTDVSVQFTRPSGFDSNHDVIDDPIVTAGNPTNYLTGDGVGTKDIYRNAASAVSQLAGSVYAVNVRARYSNASGSSHELAIVTKDAATETDSSLGLIAAGSGYKMSSLPLNKDPSGNAWTLASAAALQYGFKIKS